MQVEKGLNRLDLGIGMGLAFCAAPFYVISLFILPQSQAESVFSTVFFTFCFLRVFWNELRRPWTIELIIASAIFDQIAFFLILSFLASPELAGEYNWFAMTTISLLNHIPFYIAISVLNNRDFATKASERGEDSGSKTPD